MTLIFYTLLMKFSNKSLIEFLTYYQKKTSILINKIK